MKSVEPCGCLLLWKSWSKYCCKSIQKGKIGDFRWPYFELQIKKLYPTPAFKARLEKSLLTKPVVYSFTRNVLRTFAVHAGVKHIEWNNIFTGQLPTNLYFILLDTSQISGSIDVNPHTWLDYGCNRAHLIVNGIAKLFYLYYNIYIYIYTLTIFLGYTHPADSIRYDKTNKNIYNG